MRIAVAGFSYEGNNYSPVVTGYEALQVYRDQALLEEDLWLVSGMVARLREKRDVAIRPLIWATALPGGPLMLEVYHKVREETLRLLAEQGPFDGVCLAMHGAMEVDRLGHGDTDFILAVRKAIGPTTPLAIAFDLHGNLTPQIARAGTVFSALRTAPHRDHLQTGYRAADQLLAVIEGDLHPHAALVQIPVLIPGEVAVTHYEPAKGLYADLAQIEARDGVMQAVLMVGFAWCDAPNAGMSTLVTTRDDVRRAHTLASELARRVWEVRHDFTFHMETATVHEGIARAAASDASPVYLSDGGDNVTAGAPGDLTIVLKQMLAMGVQDAVVLGITAPQTVRQCREAGVGARFELELGREHVSAPKEIMKVTATVEAVGDSFTVYGPYPVHEGSWVRVKIGGVVATFHERAIGITTTSHFAALGINPTAHHICAVKLGYLHPELESLAKRYILLLSPGRSDFDVSRLHPKRTRRPIFPLDPEMTWTPEPLPGSWASED